MLYTKRTLCMLLNVLTVVFVAMLIGLSRGDHIELPEDLHNTFPKLSHSSSSAMTISRYRQSWPAATVNRAADDDSTLASTGKPNIATARSLRGIPVSNITSSSSSGSSSSRNGSNSSCSHARSDSSSSSSSSSSSQSSASTMGRPSTERTKSAVALSVARTIPVQSAVPPTALPMMQPAAVSAAQAKPIAPLLASTSATPATGPNLHPAYGKLHGASPTTRPSLIGSPAMSKDSGVGYFEPSPMKFSQPGATKVIKIGCVLPLSGFRKDNGQAARYGIAMALQQHMMPGFNYILQCKDSQCVDVPAFNAVDHLAAQGVVGLIGEVCSGASVAAAGRATELNVPIISPVSTASSLSKPDAFFRVVPPDHHQAAALANLAYSNGQRNTGVVHTQGTYGWGLAFDFTAAFSAKGGRIAVDIKLSPESNETATQAVVRLKAAKIDSVLLSTNNQTVALAFFKAAAAGGLRIPLYSGDALAEPLLLKNLDNASLPVLGRLTVTELSRGPPSFEVRYTNFTKGAPFYNSAALAYDATRALLAAYMAAPAPKDGRSVIQQLGNVTFDGLTGPVVFDQNGDRVPNRQTYRYRTFDVKNKRLVDVAGKVWQPPSPAG